MAPVVYAWSNAVPHDEADDSVICTTENWVTQIILIVKRSNQLLAMPNVVLIGTRPKCVYHAPFHRMLQKEMVSDL